MNLTRMLKQTAVYWALAGNSGQGPTFSDPVEVTCRWDWKQEKFMAGGGIVEELVSQAVVLCETDLAVGGFIALTDLDSLSSSQIPQDNDAYEIKGYEKVGNVRGTQHLRKAWL